MATTKDPLHRLLDEAATFVTKQKGCWQHNEWEGFLEKASKIGYEMNDESKRCIGNILEASKFFCNSEMMMSGQKGSTAPRRKATVSSKSSASSTSRRKS